MVSERCCACGGGNFVWSSYITEVFNYLYFSLDEWGQSNYSLEEQCSVDCDCMRTGLRMQSREPEAQQL